MKVQLNETLSLESKNGQLVLPTEDLKALVEDLRQRQTSLRATIEQARAQEAALTKQLLDYERILGSLVKKKRGRPRKEKATANGATPSPPTE